MVIKMNKLKITIVQPDMHWENAKANLAKYTKMLANVLSTDLIVFPEMFTTGFSMQSRKLKQTMDGNSVQWMKQLAAQKETAVLGSLIIEENSEVKNRAVWVFPDGEVQIYDKRHLFSMGDEKRHYSAGNEKIIIEYKGWKFCPLICYDLRFPVWSRNQENYDVLIYLANWPSARHHVWKSLLISRAIENQSYCIGVNRAGTDGAGLNYQGNSAVVSPKGFADYMSGEEEVRTFQLAYNELHDFRKKFPVLKDCDTFEVK